MDNKQEPITLTNEQYDHLERIAEPAARFFGKDDTEFPGHGFFTDRKANFVTQLKDGSSIVIKINITDHNKK